jgi:hypothetical protein
MKLEVELIPKTTWNINLRSKLKKSDWDKIRKSIYEKEKMCCHICGTQCKSLDAHEVWEFDEKNHVQRLIEIIGICKACHNTIHYGRAQQIGYGKEAITQYLKVNNCDMMDFQNELFIAQEDFYRRSKIDDWKLDLTLIENQGFTIKED